MSKPEISKADVHSCPDGQEWSAKENKCVPKKEHVATGQNPAVGSKDAVTEAELQLYRDSITELGYKIPKEDMNCIKSLRKDYALAKLNGKKQDTKKADSKDKFDGVPDLPGSLDKGQDGTTPKVDSEEAKKAKQDTLINAVVKYDSELAAKDPNAADKKWDSEMGAKVDALEKRFFQYSDDPFFTIEPVGGQE